VLAFLEENGLQNLSEADVLMRLKWGGRVLDADVILRGGLSKEDTRDFASVQPVQWFLLAVEQKKLRPLDPEAQHFISLCKCLHTDSVYGNRFTHLDKLKHAFDEHLSGSASQVCPSTFLQHLQMLVHAFGFGCWWCGVGQGTLVELLS